MVEVSEPVTYKQSRDFTISNAGALLIGQMRESAVAYVIVVGPMRLAIFHSRGDVGQMRSSWLSIH
jgi:hypothetical protein